MTKHSILDVAEWFLQKQRMSHKKVQKLCYYAVAWSYALYDESLFSDSQFEAWAHGPVSPVLFGKFRGSQWKYLDPDGKDIVLSDQEKELLESVMITYGGESPNALEALSHTEFPWVHARAGLEPGAPSNRLIDPNDMKSYYRSIYSGDEA